MDTFDVDSDSDGRRCAHGRRYLAPDIEDISIGRFYFGGLRHWFFLNFAHNVFVCRMVVGALEALNFKKSPSGGRIEFFDRFFRYVVTYQNLEDDEL